MPKKTPSEIHFDAILALVSGGLSVAAACASRPDFPRLAAFNGFLHRHPEYRQPIRDAVANHPLRGVRLARYKLDEICGLIERGSLSDAAIAACGVNRKSFFELLRGDETAASKYDAACRKRWANPARSRVQRRTPRRRWRAADYDSALDFIRSHSAGGVADLLGRDLPSLDSLYQRASRYPEFAARFIPVMARRAATMVAALEHCDEPSLLLAELQKNEIYRSAWRFFKGYERADRDDLISTFLLSVLEGKREAADVKNRTVRSEIVKANAGRDRSMASLNQGIFASADDGGDSEMLATIAAPCGIHTF